MVCVMFQSVVSHSFCAVFGSNPSVHLEAAGSATIYLTSETEQQKASEVTATNVTVWTVMRMKLTVS